MGRERQIDGEVQIALAIGGFEPFYDILTEGSIRREGRRAAVRCTMDEGRLSGQTCRLREISEVRFDPECCRRGYFSNVPGGDIAPVSGWP